MQRLGKTVTASPRMKVVDSAAQTCEAMEELDFRDLRPAGSLDVIPPQ